MPQQVVEHPRERGRGRLLAGHEEREHLVEQLLVAHGRTLLVAGIDQQGEDVAAARGPLGATAGDLLKQDGPDRVAVAHEAAPGRQAPKIDLERLERDERRARSVGLRDQARDALADPGERPAPADGEDDHLPRANERGGRVALAPAARPHRDRLVRPEREADPLPELRHARARRQRCGGGGGLGDERAHASLLCAQRGTRPRMTISPYSGSTSWYG